MQSARAQAEAQLIEVQAALTEAKSRMRAEQESVRELARKRDRLLRALGIKVTYTQPRRHSGHSNTAAQEQDDRAAA